MAKTAIGTAMLDILKRDEIPQVMWGDVGLLDAAFFESGSKADVHHPLDRWQIVLAALDRDSRFEKSFVKIDLFVGKAYQTRIVRLFKISP